MRICIYAFSSTALFFRALIDACAAAGDQIEWSVICPQGHFRHVFASAVPPERLCYLYQNFNDAYAECGDSQIQSAMESGSGLIPSLMRDKDGYRWLDKAEQLKRGATIHFCYRGFLEKLKPDFVLFPNLEVVDGFILMNFCRTMGIGVLYCTSMRFLGRSFFSPDPYETLPSYFGNYTDADIQAACRVLQQFRQRSVSYVPGVGFPPSPPPKPSLLRRLVVSEYLRRGPERLHATEETLAMRIYRNIRGLMAILRGWGFELTANRYFDAVETNVLPEKYVLYALHYTPESAINGLEPYYVDQFRAIDALLLNLPPGYRLVAKEHPTMYGRRPLAFYRELSRRPGLVLLHPKRDTRVLMEKSSLVATVTGTVGLEAFLLGKPCLAFGPSFFAHLCQQAPAQSGLRTIIENLIASHVPPTEAEKEIEIAKMLNVGGNFLIDDAWLQPTTMAPKNIKNARDYFWRHLTRLKDSKDIRGRVRVVSNQTTT
jgi:hypothetical protein